ncbi:MAG TPA: class I SAM-dependent methyltransferase [Thermoplasmata archaeon]|nr:class I SAM-dependent methyltransferase [Thermoplasmata archaeon]
MSGRSRGGDTTHLRVNRRLWDRVARSYERSHERSLRRVPAESWGLYRISERRLELLGPVRGRRLLELGCGAALWSASLARRGARVVAFDFSAARLRQASTEVRKRAVPVRLLRANAERLPFRAASFDLAFCDWGALTFADPRRTIPEAARVLRNGGRLVFSTANPLRSVVEDRGSRPIGRRLRWSYFDLGRIRYGNEVNFQLPFGGWVELFRASGLTLERLVEPRAPVGTRSTYLTKAQREWGRRWPLEAIWSLRKEPAPRRSATSRERRSTRPPLRSPRARTAAPRAPPPARASGLGSGSPAAGSPG